MPNIADVLTQDHLRIDRLFQQFERTRDPVVVLEACELLERHTEIEERCVYSVLRQQVSQLMADHAEDEHQDVSELIDEVRSCDMEDRFAQLVTLLRHAIRSHVEEEESRVLPAMQRKLGQAAMERLGTTFLEARRELGRSVLDVTEPTEMTLLVRKGTERGRLTTT